MKRMIRTDSKNSDFVHLVEKLDSELAERDGEEHSFYHQFNNIDSIKHVVVLYKSATAVGCGGIKEHNSKTMEVKRMYLTESFRGKGLATKILRELEKWANELGYTDCVLETGKRQPEAIALYQKNGYRIIDNYGQYQGIENSLCFKKNVSF